MSKIITSTKEFEVEFKGIKQNRKNIEIKVNQVYEYLNNNGIDKNISKFFDFKNIGEGYYRFKFPPFRLIIKDSGNYYIFKKIFKRKGNSDYKDYY